MTFRIDSEVGQLRQVILHRPGPEMNRLTPENRDELLYDDLLWLEKGQEEHDIFADTLRQHDVEVLYFQDLLAESIENPWAKEYLLENTFDERRYGVAANDAMRTYAESLSAPDLAQLLVAGITKSELLSVAGDVRSVYLDVVDPDFLVLGCLPNHLFTRDTSSWIYDGVSINSMQKVARKRESINCTAIYHWHPLFSNKSFNRWSNGIDDEAATVEGGDVLVLGKGVVLVGLSERTTPAGLERLARKLFANSEVQTVLGLQLPWNRAFMHLDTVLTMVDEESFVFYKNLGNLPTFTLQSGDTSSEISVTPNAPEKMWDVIAEHMGLSQVRILSTPQDSSAAQRDQWNDGCNLLAIKPGLTVAYERNQDANDYIRSQGIEVLEVPGNELGRGRGGPRCMSCPTLRDSI